MYTEDSQSTCITEPNIKWENEYDNDINWGKIWGNSIKTDKK
jgi:hypothetical protein